MLPNEKGLGGSGMDLPPRDAGSAREDQVFGRRLLRDDLSGVVCLYNLSGAFSGSQLTQHSNYKHTKQHEIPGTEHIRHL